MSEVTSELERRIHRLEIVNRVLLAGVVIALVVPWARSGASASGVDAAGALAADQVVPLISARRIQVVDDQGRVRVDLHHDQEETGLFILDEQGDTRVGAAQFAHGGGGYALHGPGGRGAAVLYLKGEGSLTMYDGDGAVASRFPEAR